MIKWIKKQIDKLLENYPLVKWILIIGSAVISIVLVILAVVYIRQWLAILIGGAFVATGGSVAYKEISKKVKDVKKKNNNPDYNSTSNALDGIVKRKRKTR